MATLINKFQFHFIPDKQKQTDFYFFKLIKLVKEINIFFFRKIMNTRKVCAKILQKLKDYENK